MTTGEIQPIGHVEKSTESVEPFRSTRLESARVRRDELREAMQLLENTASRPVAGANWIDLVGAAVQRLQLALAEHIAATEGPEGLLEEVLQTAPRLAHEAEALTAEHKALVERLRQLNEAVARPTAVSTVRRRVMALLGRLVEHRQRGSDFVYEAYQVDIGSAG
jgi:hypothetical protein